MTRRRDLLATSALAAAGFALAPLAASAQRDPAAPVREKPAGAIKRRSAVPGTLLTREIPSSGEAIPVIGAGTSGSYEVAVGSPEYDALGEVARIFFEGGGSVVDTSPNYSNAEDVVGALLAEGGWRDQCFLATKLAADSREALEAQWADSKRRLRTDTVELLLVHNLRNWDQAWPYAKELKASGAAKYIGMTHYLEKGHADLERLMREVRPDFIQVNYSVNAPQAARTLLPAAADLGVAVMVNRAFDDGKLFGKVGNAPLPGWAAEAGITSWAQMFLKFAVSHPAVTVVIPATGKPERQTDQLKAGTGPLLTRAQQDELLKRFA